MSMAHCTVLCSQVALIILSFFVGAASTVITTKKVVPLIGLKNSLYLAILLGSVVHLFSAHVASYPTFLFCVVSSPAEH